MKLLAIIAAASFGLTITPQQPPVLDFTVTFENVPVGQRLDWPTMKTLFNDPSVGGLANYNYVYTNNTACMTTNGTTDSANNPCTPAPRVAAQIVSDGKSGNGLQVLADNGLCGYDVNGFGTPHFGIGLLPTYNVIDVEWDEMWRPGFDLHSEGKIGILTLFKDPSLPLWYGPQNMFYKDSVGSTTKFSPVMLNMGDYGTSNPRGSVVEAQVYPTPEWNLGQWYHFKVEIALGPNGWYKAWVDGVLYNSYPPNPGNVSPTSSGQSIAGGPSTTDAITTTNPTPLATGDKSVNIQPHFGGQPDHTTWALGSGDCMRTNSYIVYDNIHVTAYNK